MIDKISLFIVNKTRALTAVIAIIFLGYFIGRNIVRSNPYFWLIVVASPVLLVLLKNTKLGILLIILSVFFADWLYGTGLIPAQLTWLPEVVLLIYVIKAVFLRKKFIATPIDIPIILFCVVAVISMFITSTSPISVLLALRLDLKFILMFYLLINLDFDEYFFKRIMSMLILLLVIQVPVAIGKYMRFGQMEASIGTYGSFGGGLSTILPLFAISLFFGLYLIADEKPRGKYIFFILGYLIFPILAGKRGFLFYSIPLIAFLAWQAKGKYFRKIVPVSMILLPGFLASIYFVPTLRPALHNPKYLWEYSLSYETRRFGTAGAGGRIAAIEDTYVAVKKDPFLFLFGYGPGSTIKSYFKAYDKMAGSKVPVKIFYGFTHLVSTVIEYGYLGFLFYFLLPLIILFKMNQKFYKKIEDRYWKAISFGFGGILFSSFVLGLFYWDLFRIDLSGFLFWFFAAIIYSIGKSHKIL